MRTIGSRDIVMGIDPGLAHTGWGIVQRCGGRFSCMAYGCVTTTKDTPLHRRLLKIYQQIGAVTDRYRPYAVGIETIWFGENTTSAFATGQARGAALVACAEHGLDLGEYAPSTIKQTVVGTGSADKHQVQYMVQHLLSLAEEPKPDHAADALAAAICYLVRAVPSGMGEYAQ